MKRNKELAERAANWWAESLRELNLKKLDLQETSETTKKERATDLAAFTRCTEKEINEFEKILAKRIEEALNVIGIVNIWSEHIPDEILLQSASDANIINGKFPKNVVMRISNGEIKVQTIRW